MSRTLRLGLLAAGLLLCGLSAPVALSDEGAAPTAPDLGAPPTDAGAQPIRWVDGFAPGAAKARESGKILFVWVTRVNPPCPHCDGLRQRVFEKPDSGRISERYVAVRVLGGDDATPEVDAFMERYGVEGYPALLAMTPDGALLSKIPTYVNGKGFLGTGDFLAALDEAAKEETAFQARRKEALAKDEVGAWAEIATALVQRTEYAAARDVHRRILAKQPISENYEMLAYLDHRIGDAAAERATLEEMVKRFPDDDDRIDWRIRLATLDLAVRPTGGEGRAAVVDRHVAALRGLLATVETEGRLADQSAVHNVIADLLLQKEDYDGMKAELLWITEKDAQGKRAPGAHRGIAFVAYQRGDLATAIHHLEEVLAKYPDSPEAKEAKDVLPTIREEAKPPPK